MKYSYLFLLTLFILFFHCSEEPGNNLEGCWLLDHGSYTSPDTTVILPLSESDRRVKIITGQYFVTVWQDTSVEESHGFNGGTYTLYGDTYTENLHLFINPDLVGRSFQYEAKLEGDKWTIAGRIDDTELLEGMAQAEVKTTKHQHMASTAGGLLTSADSRSLSNYRVAVKTLLCGLSLLIERRSISAYRSFSKQSRSG